MLHKEEINFQFSRDSLALKCPYPSADELQFQRQRDRNLNPYNDTYKPKLRCEAEIVSDVCYQFADTFLKQQYGRKFQEWKDSVQ